MFVEPFHALFDDYSFYYTVLNVIYSLFCILCFIVLSHANLLIISFLPVHPGKLGDRTVKHLFIAVLAPPLAPTPPAPLLFSLSLTASRRFRLLFTLLYTPLYSLLHLSYSSSIIPLLVSFRFLVSALLSMVSKPVYSLFPFHPLSFLFAFPHCLFPVFFPAPGHSSNFLVLVILSSPAMAVAGGAAVADSKCQNQTPEVQAGSCCLGSLERLDSGTSAFMMWLGYVASRLKRSCRLH